MNEATIKKVMREMGRKGGKKGGPKGGKARMATLTPEERQELGRKAGKKSGMVRRRKAAMKRESAKSDGPRKNQGTGGKIRRGSEKRAGSR